MHGDILSGRLTALVNRGTDASMCISAMCYVINGMVLSYTHTNILQFDFESS